MVIQISFLLVNGKKCFVDFKFLITYNADINIANEKIQMLF